MSKAIKIPFAFRAATETDRPLVLQSWLRTWREEQKHMRSDSYYRQAHSLFTQILDKFGAVVAVNPEDPDQIYGFAVAAYLSNDEWVLFWIQTKSLYAKLGIGKALYKFIRGDRPHGPICPFIRRKSKNYINKYDILEAPLMITQIMLMEEAKGVDI